MAAANWLITPSNLKQYVAIITQSGTSVPTVTVLVNTLGALVWSYDSVGNYRATLAGAFTNNKTVCFINIGENFNGNDVGFARNSDDDLFLVTTVLSVSAGNLVSTPDNDILTNALIEIRVYP